ncbi:MAG: sugar phosphate nucleotidyltransferase [Candidatus Kapaibacterium sp.]
MNLGILAAGDGQRLKDEGIIDPKPLLRVGGITLLERALKITDDYGFDSCNIIINDKFKDDVINSRIFDNYKNLIINCIYKSTLSSLHSLNELDLFLSNDSFCLMTIDSIYSESEFASFIKTARDEAEYDGLIAVTGYVDDEKPLWVNTDKDNIITEFSSIKDDANFVTGGIYYFRKGIIDYTDEALLNNISKLRNFLQYLVESGIRLKAMSFSKIIDLDHKNDLVEAVRFLKEMEKSS